MSLSPSLLDRLLLLGVVVLATALGSRLRADDCFIGDNCTATVPDAPLGSPESADVTPTPAGLRITKLGYNDVNTGIPYNHGNTNASAVLVKIRKSTCIEDHKTLGAKVVPPGTGKLAGNGKCGKTTRRISYQYVLTYNAGDGTKTATYEAKPAADESGSDPCGPQRIGTVDCGGGQ